MSEFGHNVTVVVASNSLQSHIRWHAVGRISLVRRRLRRACEGHTRGCWICRNCTEHRLFELIADLVEAGSGAVIVKIGAGRASGADRAHHFVAHLDHDAATEQHQVRQLGE